MKSFFFLIVLLALFAGCAENKKPADRMTDDELRAFADELAHQYIITDGHVDLPFRLKMSNFRVEREYMGIPIQTDEGDFDYERAKKGGLDAPFMSIYIPSSYQLQPDMGKALADSLINMVRGIAENIPDKFALANTPEDVQRNFEEGKISLPMGMENGAPVGNDIANVKYFHERGIRYITLTHGKDNQICDSSYDTTSTWNGLSPYGREVVAEMNRVGIMVDISHVSDSTFYQVMKLTKVPVIASHSSCRAFTPGFIRNMSDDMIKKLGENGGVIQINFGSTFLDSAVSQQNDINRKKLQEQLSAQNLSFRDSLAKPIIEQFRKDNPSLYADVETVANHIDHVVKLAGINHVGIGSDYDGVGDSLPTGLKDVSQYPNLIYSLLKRGYTEEDIEKICYKNVFRVWSQVTEAAE
ncbi:MAG: membrane dipeptidase [Flammeovirgaceae bacterium]|nr:membrane dipeptidase [Flammeovirgaceae bacterium]